MKKLVVCLFAASLGSLLHAEEGKPEIKTLDDVQELIENAQIDYLLKTAKPPVNAYGDPQNTPPTYYTATQNKFIKPSGGFITSKKDPKRPMNIYEYIKARHEQDSPKPWQKDQEFAINQTRGDQQCLQVCKIKK